MSRVPMKVMRAYLLEAAEFSALREIAERLEALLDTGRDWRPNDGGLLAALLAKVEDSGAYAITESIETRPGFSLGRASYQIERLSNDSPTNRKHAMTMTVTDEDAREVRAALRVAGKLAEHELDLRGPGDAEYEVRAGDVAKKLAKALAIIESRILASIMQDMSLSALVLSRLPNSGNWRLYAPGVTEEQIRSGAKPLASGPAEWVDGYRWSRPTRLDYTEARAVLARALLDVEDAAHV